jgi:uncharacterized protein (TIGR03086 family)
MDPQDVFARAVEHWQDVVQGVQDNQWDAPTPCTDWDVRALVNHVVGEGLWVAPLLAGRTVEEVGDTFDGDLLDGSPRAAAARAAAAAREAFAEPGAADRTVHLSYGAEQAREYAWQLAADHLVHAWDLAVATDQDTHLPPGLVDAVARWYAEREEGYRGAGLVAGRVEVDEGASAQARLLSAFGRDPAWAPARR